MRHAAAGRGRPTSSPSVLPPGALTLRTVDLTADDPAAVHLLGPAERAYADAGSPAVRRRRVLLRAALRIVAGEVVGLPPAAVPLSAPPGRPTLAGFLAGADVHLSCSASAGFGLVAVARGAEVGVDVELIDAAAADDDWLSAAERAAVAALPRAERPAVRTRCWTQKEAVLKGLGTGLRTDPRRVSTLGLTRGAGRIGAWQLSPVPVPPGWAATVAVRPTIAGTSAGSALAS